MKCRNANIRTYDVASKSLFVYPWPTRRSLPPSQLFKINVDITSSFHGWGCILESDCKSTILELQKKKDFKGLVCHYIQG